jgi:hypothetical protein
MLEFELLEFELLLCDEPLLLLLLLSELPIGC